MHSKIPVITATSTIVRILLSTLSEDVPPFPVPSPPGRFEVAAIDGTARSSKYTTPFLAVILREAERSAKSREDPTANVSGVDGVETANTPYVSLDQLVKVVRPSKMGALR